MAILTISLLLSVVEQFLQNFCSAPLKEIELHLVLHMEVLQEAKTQQMYNEVCSPTGYKNNPGLQSTLGSGTLSRQHLKVDLTNWKDRYSIFPPQTLCINRVMVTWPKVHKMEIELQGLRFEQGSGRTGVDSFLLGLGGSYSTKSWPCCRCLWQQQCRCELWMLRDYSWIRMVPSPPCWWVKMMKSATKIDVQCEKLVKKNGWYVCLH